MSVFGERIQELKNERGLTNRKIENLSGVNHSRISSYINEGKMPNSNHLIKLCKALDVSADYMLGLSNHRKRKK